MTRLQGIESAHVRARFIGEYEGGILRADVLIGGALELRSVSLVQGMLTFPRANKREAVAVSVPLAERITAAIRAAKTAGRSRNR